MVMSTTTLKNELLNLPDTFSEVEAINNWTAAYSNYIVESSCGGVSPLAPTLVSAESAMATAMVGLSVSGQGATKLVAGIAAYWGVLSVAASTVWVLVPPLTTITVLPTGVLGQPAFVSALTSVFASNIAGVVDKDPAVEAVASVIHTQSQGGVALQSTTPSPTPQPIT